MRLLLYTFDDSTLPAPNGVFEQLGIVEAPFSPINIVNNHKIHVLCERLVTIYPVAGSYAAEQFVMSCDCDVLVQLPAALPSAAAQQKGMYLTYVSDDIVPAFPSLFYQSRCVFEDA